MGGRLLHEIALLSLITSFPFQLINSYFFTAIDPRPASGQLSQRTEVTIRSHGTLSTSAQLISTQDKESLRFLLY